MFSHDYVEVMHFWQEHRNALSVSCQGENNILKYHLDFDFLAILPLSSASLLRKHLMAWNFSCHFTSKCIERSRKYTITSVI